MFQNLKQISSILNANGLQKKPIEQLCQSYFMLQQHEQNKPCFNINQTCLSPPYKQNIQQNLENTTKLAERKIQNIDEMSKTCIRLFTFMQSTQRDRKNQQNKENLQPSNVNYAQIDTHKLTKGKSTFLSLSQSQTPTILPKRKSQKQKFEAKENVVYSEIQNIKQIQLTSFIQESRRKRQLLLLELEKYDNQNLTKINNKLDNLHNFRRQRSLKTQIMKQRSSTSNNSLNNTRLKETDNKRYNFLKQNRASKCDLSLKQRKFSLVSLRKNRQTLTPKRQVNQRPKSARNSFLPLKNDKRYIKCSNKQTQFLKKDISRNKIMVNSKPSIQNLKDINKTVKIKNTTPKYQKMHLKQCRRKQTKGKTNKQNNQSRNSIQGLLLKKKQLQKELVTINDQILLFNKKKKKPTKS